MIFGADLSVLRDVFARASPSNAGDADALTSHPGALDFEWPDDRQVHCMVAVDTSGTVVGPGLRIARSV